MDFSQLGIVAIADSFLVKGGASCLLPFLSAGTHLLEHVQILCMLPVSVSEYLYRSGCIWKTLFPWHNIAPLAPRIFHHLFHLDR